MKRGRRTRDDSGFTLVELAVAIVLSGLVLSTIGAAYSSGLTANRKVDTNSKAQRDGRLVMDQLARELRSRGGIVTPSSPVVSPDPGPLAITFTTVRDEAAGIQSHTIHYEVSGGRLWKSTDNQNLQSVIDGLNNSSLLPLFTYYDASGTALTTGVAASTRRVTVSLSISTGKGGEPLVLTTDISFRSY